MLLKISTLVLNLWPRLLLEWFGFKMVNDVPLSKADWEDTTVGRFRHGVSPYSLASQNLKKETSDTKPILSHGLVLKCYYLPDVNFKVTEVYVFSQWKPMRPRWRSQGFTALVAKSNSECRLRRELSANAATAWPHQLYGRTMCSRAKHGEVWEILEIFWGTACDQNGFMC